MKKKTHSLPTDDFDKVVLGAILMGLILGFVFGWLLLYPSYEERKTLENHKNETLDYKFGYSFSGITETKISCVVEVRSGTKTYLACEGI